MTRINTNVPSLIAQNRLQSSNQDLNTALTRLSTGLRINSGADDPAGLIASEALRSEITSLGKAVSNTNRASQIISTADSALGEVSNLLNDIRGLVVEAANSGALSDEEIAANQLQIDSSLEAINRIAQTTTFQGRKLLDGSLDFTSTANGVDSISDINIDQANLGATGSINVDVEVNAAATRASISSTGVPPSTTSASSTGTITFGSPVAADEASGTATFASSSTVGVEAANPITFANATTPDGEAVATLTLSSGVDLTVTAVDDGPADGTVGNDTTVNVITQTTGTSSASFDAATNVLTLTVTEGQTTAQLATDLGTDANFAFTAGASGPAITDAGDTGNYTDPVGPGAPGYDVTTLGTDATDATTGFTLSAVDGGAADGAVGNDTTLTFASGTSNSAVYDAAANELIVSLVDGATIQDAYDTINSDVGADFVASNLNNGDYTYSITDSGSTTNALTGGTSPTLAGTFDLEAVNTGAADGTTGNDTTLNLIAGTGVGTTALFNADTNQVDITVGEGATIEDIANAINDDGTLLTRNLQNGNALFNAADLGTNDPAFTGGTDDSVDDVITVRADDPSATFDGTTISLAADNSLAAGTASASLDTDGNIVVNVSSLGEVAVGTISQAISDLDGFTAEVSAAAGDGSVDIVSELAAGSIATADLAGGVFGGGLNADLVVQVRGAEGSEVFQFEKGASLESIVQSINLVSDATGVLAEDDGGSLKLSSQLYGSDGTIDIEVISEGAGGTFKSGLTSSTAAGTDISATVNGITADGDGNSFSINTSTLDINLTVNDGSSDNFTFAISGGGAKFQLGPDVTTTQQARLGIGSLSTGQLGGPAGRLYELGSGQAKSLTNDVGGAAKVIDDVISKVTGLRGRLGAFQATTLNSNLVSLKETQANLLEAESSIRDADFAQESANLTRAQILTQSGTNVLSLANQNPQNVLALLG
ncbi:B-type flagellin [Rubripirellula obstinata]|uniref:Flagellin n=1 Tax=Rubripirellula obstinata TaxID=406547 RepID=A0A5B1CJP8_9BACT|nr:flagellin [Rubripirellula obstinata]KAA1259750.1 B-type flagellin [Rubripirellula obstinata]